MADHRSCAWVAGAVLVLAAWASAATVVGPSLSSDARTYVVIDNVVGGNPPEYVEAPSGSVGYDTNGSGNHWGSNRRWSNGVGTTANWTYVNLPNGTYDVLASWRSDTQTNLTTIRYSVSDGGPTTDLNQVPGTASYSGAVTLTNVASANRQVTFAPVGRVSVSDGALAVTGSKTVSDGNFVFFDATAVARVATGASGYDYTTMTNEPPGSSYSYGVGNRFVAADSIDITSLGFAAWEATQTGFLPAGATPVTVQLYDYNAASPDSSVLLASATFTPGAAAAKLFDPGPAGNYLAYEWQSALGAPVSLREGNDYMVVAYGFSNNAGNAVHYLNGPIGTTIASSVSHVYSYYNSTSRGVGDAPNVADVLGPRYGGPTFEFTVAAPGAVVKVIDNGDPGYSTVAFNEQGGVNDAFDDNQAWNANNTTAVASYLFDDLEPGFWEVYATWRQSGQANVGNAFFSISDGGGVVQVDQRVGPDEDYYILDNTGEWMRFELLALVQVLDGQLQVDLRPPSGSGYVLADAVAVRQVVPEPGTIILLAGCLGGLGRYLRRRRGA